MSESGRGQHCSNPPRRELFDADLYNGSISVLKAALTANKRVRKGRGEYEDIPDHKLRVETARYVLDHEHGRASNRLEINDKRPNVPALASADHLERLKRDNPELAAKIAQNYLDSLQVVSDVEFTASED